MQSEDETYAASRAATRKIIDSINLPDQRQFTVMAAASDGIAISSTTALSFGCVLGLTAQQSVDAIKVALAAYLAGLDAMKFDEIGRKQ